jgi:rRNA maturation endonuclease Nob1
MEIIQQFKELLPNSTEEQTYTYRCNVCQTKFTSTESHMGKVACEACGASNVRDTTTEQ